MGKTNAMHNKIFIYNKRLFFENTAINQAQVPGRGVPQVLHQGRILKLSRKKEDKKKRNEKYHTSKKETVLLPFLIIKNEVMIN